MGRRKISIAPIADDRNRSVTFLKRKNGLFKKAYELGILCSADVAVVVFSSTGKLFEFSSSPMDPILLKYSNYQGPPHERRGPADYASKETADLAKRGLGGKMTTLSDNEDEEDAEVEGDDGTGGDDDSVEEPRKPVVKKASTSAAARRRSSASTPLAPKLERSPSVLSNSVSEASGQQPFSFHSTAEAEQLLLQQQQHQIQQHQQQQQHQHQLQQQQLATSSSLLGNPFTQQQGFPNPYLPPGFMNGIALPPWAYPPGASSQPPPSTSAGPAMSRPPTLPQLPLPPINLPPQGWNAFMSPLQQHQFIQQFQAEHQRQLQAQAQAQQHQYSTQGASGIAYPGTEFATHQLQSALQQSQQQHGFYPSAGPATPSVPEYSPTHPSVMPPRERRGTGASSVSSSSADSVGHMQRQRMGGEAQRGVPTPPPPGSGGLSRSNSRAERSDSQKPRLSVSIPSEERRAGGGGAGGGGPIIDQALGHPAQGQGGTQGEPIYTDEPEGMGEDDDGGGLDTALPSGDSARFASELLPSPAGFLNDILYSAGPFSLQTAMALPNRHDSSVFEWPTKAVGGPSDEADREGGREDTFEVAAASLRRLKRGSEELPSPITAQAREEDDRMDAESGRSSERSSDEMSSVNGRKIRMRTE